MKKIIFILLFISILQPCFSQELDDIVLIGEIINLILDSYNKNNSLINSQQLEDNLYILNNIFSKTSDYRFTDGMFLGVDNFGVFQDRKMIGNFSIPLEYRLNGENIMEFVFLVGTINENSSNIKIAAENESSKNIYISFDNHDINDGIIYVYEYYINQYEMLVIYEFELNPIEEHYNPLIRKTIIYNKNIN